MLLPLLKHRRYRGSRYDECSVLHYTLLSLACYSAKQLSQDQAQDIPSQRIENGHNQKLIDQDQENTTPHHNPESKLQKFEHHEPSRSTHRRHPPPQRSRSARIPITPTHTIIIRLQARRVHFYSCPVQRLLHMRYQWPLEEETQTIMRLLLPANSTPFGICWESSCVIGWRIVSCGIEMVGPWALGVGVGHCGYTMQLSSWRKSCPRFLSHT